MTTTPHALTILTTDHGFRAGCSCGWQGEERSHVFRVEHDHRKHRGQVEATTGESP